MRWSQLQQLIQALMVPALDFKIFCTVQRPKGREPGAPIGRFWVTLGGETVWDEPEGVSQMIREGRRDDFAPQVTALLRSYLETPREQLIQSEAFSAHTFDNRGLLDLLRACDRRIGARRLPELYRNTSSEAARLAIVRRLGGPPGEPHA